MSCDEEIVFCAFRYALGRMTYITAVVADVLIEKQSEFSLKYRQLIVGEIKQAIANGRAGMESVDVPIWQRVVDEFEPNLQYEYLTEGD